MVKLFIRIFESILKSKDDFDRIFSLFLFKRREIDDRISKYRDNVISTSPLLPTASSNLISNILLGGVTDESING